MATEVYFDKAIAKKWPWGMVVKDCVSFYEEYSQAGGSTWSMRTNLPTLHDSRRPDDFIGNWLSDVYRRADNEIRRIYGVPF
jgi:hypothetical protein